MVAVAAREARALVNVRNSSVLAFCVLANAPKALDFCIILLPGKIGAGYLGGK